MRHTSTKLLTIALVLTVTNFLPVSTAFAADLELSMVIKNHMFEPSELKVPANQRDQTEYSKLRQNSRRV